MQPWATNAWGRSAYPAGGTSARAGRSGPIKFTLRAHPDAAAAYGRLKQELAAAFPEDIEGYCDGKDAFVQKLEADALAWYAHTGRM